MNQKNVRDKLRVNTNSPPPESSIKKSVSLEAILKASSGKYHPDKCFGLDVPYRNAHRYNPHTHFAPIIKGASRSSTESHSPHSPHPIRVWGSQLSGLPLSKSRSMPEFHLESDRERKCHSTPVERWSCKACLTDDPRKLQQGSDSAMVCTACGAVESHVEMIALDRSKNCPKSEDNTAVADAPCISAQDAANAALVNGHESAADRRLRLQIWSGGTRMSTKLLKRTNLLSAQNKIDNDAVKSLKESIEGKARDELIRRGIINVMMKLFVQINGLDEKIEKHIRLEAIRIYTASLQHESVCHFKGCMLCLSSSANAVVAFTMTEHTMEALCQASNGRGSSSPYTTTIASLAPWCTTQQVQSQLVQVKQLKLRYASPVHRMQVASAITIIAGWTRQEALLPCPEPAPPALRLPPSVARSPDDYGKTTTPDPGDVTIKLRQRLHDSAQITRTRGDVRNVALMYLAVPEAIAFLRSDELTMWSVDLLSCLLLTCSSIKTKCTDETERLRMHTLGVESISPTTFMDAVAALLIVVKDFVPPREADDLYYS